MCEQKYRLEKKTYQTYSERNIKPLNEDESRHFRLSTIRKERLKIPIFPTGRLINSYFKNETSMYVSFFYTIITNSHIQLRQTM